MKECTDDLMVERLHELGKTDVEIDEIINMAKEYSKHADAVYINREGTKGYLNMQSSSISSLTVLHDGSCKIQKRSGNTWSK
jgi:hypothetical protein